jgi:hypothetical protein
MTTERPCGCPLDAPDHLDPEPDWIGDTPIMHGERDEPSTSFWGAPCLCGHPNYLTCCEVWGGSMAGMTVARADAGELHEGPTIHMQLPETACPVWHPPAGEEG